MLQRIIILIQGFCPLKIKITQLSNGFRTGMSIEKKDDLNCLTAVTQNLH